MAQRLEQALKDVQAVGLAVTCGLKLRPDDQTTVGTSEVADAVIEQMWP